MVFGQAGKALESEPSQEISAGLLHHRRKGLHMGVWPLRRVHIPTVAAAMSLPLSCMYLWPWFWLLGKMTTVSPHEHGV